MFENIKSKKDRATARAMLRRAKADLKESGACQKGVCCLVDEASFDMQKERGVYYSFNSSDVKRAERLGNIANAITDEIAARINTNGWNCYVSSWLMQQLNLSFEQVRPHMNDYRQRWIDSMIAELQ